MAEGDPILERLFEYSCESDAYYEISTASDPPPPTVDEFRNVIEGLFRPCCLDDEYLCLSYRLYRHMLFLTYYRVMTVSSEWCPGDAIPIRKMYNDEDSISDSEPPQPSLDEFRDAIEGFFGLYEPDDVYQRLSYRLYRHMVFLKYYRAMQ